MRPNRLRLTARGFALTSVDHDDVLYLTFRIGKLREINTLLSSELHSLDDHVLGADIATVAATTVGTIVRAVLAQIDGSYDLEVGVEHTIAILNEVVADRANTTIQVRIAFLGHDALVELDGGIILQFYVCIVDQDHRDLGIADTFDSTQGARAILTQAISGRGIVNTARPLIAFSQVEDLRRSSIDGAVRKEFDLSLCTISDIVGYDTGRDKLTINDRGVAQIVVDIGVRIQHLPVEGGVISTVAFAMLIDLDGRTITLLHRVNHTLGGNSMCTQRHGQQRERK